MGASGVGFAICTADYVYCIHGCAKREIADAREAGIITCFDKVCTFARSYFTGCIAGEPGRGYCVYDCGYDIEVTIDATRMDCGRMHRPPRVWCPDTITVELNYDARTKKVTKGCPGGGHH